MYYISLRVWNIKKPEPISVCKVHQYEILLRHLKAHGAITLSQIKNTLKITKEEAMILMREVKEKKQRSVSNLQ